MRQGVEVRLAGGRRARARRRIAAGLTAGLLVWPSLQARAQTSAAQAVDEGLRRQAEHERIEREAARPQARALSPASAPAPLPELPEERPCFPIHEFALAGPDAARFSWIAASLTPLLDHCIGAQGLGRIADHLNTQLLAQGYVTSRIALAPQNLAAGRLSFTLQTGRIERIRMVDADAPERPEDSRWGTWRNAFPTHAGALLDARDLEQGVEQMKRLPSQSVSTTLAPGSEPGGTVVTIERHGGSLRERVRGSLTLDNAGSSALGRTQAAARLALDNPLGLNDVLSLGANSNAEHPARDHRGQGWDISYSLPWGYSTFSFSAGHSRFAQIVQLPTLPHVSSGSADTAEARWQHTAWRTASAKTGVYAALSTRRSRSSLDDTELLNQRRRTTFWELGLNFLQLYPGDATLALDLGYRRGVPWLNAQQDLPADPQDPAAVPTLRPRLWLLNASFSEPFTLAGRRFQYSAALRAQSTPDHTLTIDQIAIGNRYTVRGFDGDAVLIAESGWVLRNELATPLAFAAASSQAYLALDAGRVWGPSDASLPGHALAGAALGLRSQYKALQFDLALATPLAKPAGFQAAPWSLYASASCVF